MAFLNVNTPLKNLKTGDYFYPLTNLDQIITGSNRLSAFMSEDNNLLNLSNIGNLSVNGTSYFGNLSVNGTSYFANTITGDILSAWHILAGRPSNTTNFRTYFETVANLHHDNPNRTDSEMSYNRWFASNSDQTTYGPSALNLPVVDQHVLSFGIDDGVAYSRHIAFDIRTNAVYVGARNNNTWSNWEQLVRNTGTWNISITGSANYLAGFASSGTSNASWGNQTGSTVCWNNESNGGSFDFRRDNPSSGKLSLKVDGRFYGNEGNYPAMLMNYTNSYWGMGDADGASNNWIRTTSSGIIPYQSGGFGNGHCGLGTSSWYFSYSYIDTMYGVQAGPLKSTGSVSVANSTWGASNPWNCGNRQLVWGESGRTSASSDSADLVLYYGTHGSAGGAGFFLSIDGGINSLAGIYTAVWNDFAEYRVSDEHEPGYAIAPAEDGKNYLTTERMQPGARIISDTFGQSVGYCDEARTPLGVSGRVLAYPARPREEYKIGDCVCAAPEGKIDIMTREEIMMYPDRIIGIVNEIPKYDFWERTVTEEGEGAKQHHLKTEVKGRIWIDIK